jgi:CPA1 family monovalent cation:H+ antiporter
MCEDLKDLLSSDFPSPRTPGECEDCRSEGTTWVALRMCRDCGHVGCCDSSPRRHATRHYQTTQHRVIRSAMPGDMWTWCYVHGAYGAVDQPIGQAAKG